MATITTILGTDSVSSSRVTLNDNFAAINQELADIALLLDVLNETIELSGLAKFGSLNIANGKVIATSSALTSAVATTINEKFTIGQSVFFSTTTGVTALPASGAFNSATYFLDGSTIAASPVTVNTGLNGQEITLIADSNPTAGGTTISVANIAGPASIKILNKGTLTLRYVSSPTPKWYIVSSYNVTFA